jgi:PAS domain S-box-containing protein
VGGLTADPVELTKLLDIVQSRFVEANIIGIVVWGRDGSVLDANRAFLDLVGYSREELVSGRVSWMGMTPPEYRELDRRALDEIDATGRCRPFEKVYVGHDGVRVPVMVAGAAFDDRVGGRVERGIAFVLDMREQARLRSKLEELLARAQQAHRETEEANTRLLLVAQAGRDFGRSHSAEDTMMTLARLCIPALADWCVIWSHGDSSPATGLHGDPGRYADIRTLCGLSWLPESVASVFRSGATQLHTSVTDSDLAPASVESSRVVRSLDPRSFLCIPIAARGRVEAVAMLVCSTVVERFAREDVLLAEELAGRAAASLETDRLLTEAFDAVRARDEFLSVAAHELRTPLTALLLRLKLVRASIESAPLDTPSALLSIESADSQARRLAALVDRLLDVSRAAAGRIVLQTEEVDLVRVVRDVLSSMTHELARAGCSLEVDTPRELRGAWDRMRIEQLVTNLLSNAIKFGKGARIEVRLSASDDQVRISVRDHGIGIATEDHARIFGRYERAVSARHFGGLGLGLYVCSEIARAHGGRIRLESELGQGACFIVELPRTP